MATFGRTDNTFDYRDADANYIWGSEYTCPEVGTASKITAYVQEVNASGTVKGKAALYNASKGLVAVSDEITYNASTLEWRDYPFSSPPGLTNQVYYLLICNNNQVYLHRKQEAGASRWYDALAYTSFPPDPFVQDGSGADMKYCIYCTYSTGGGGGWTHKMMGIAAANIAKVNGIPIANIAKIRGV